MTLIMTEQNLRPKLDNIQVSDYYIGIGSSSKISTLNLPVLSLKNG